MRAVLFAFALLTWIGAALNLVFFATDGRPISLGVGLFCVASGAYQAHVLWSTR